MEEIINKIQKLKNIKPRPAFVLESKRVILSSVQAPRKTVFSFWLPLPRLVLSCSAVMAALTLALFSVNLAGQAPTVAKIYDLNRETESAVEKIDITLKEINYFNENAQVASLALDEAASNGLRHLNAAVLEGEMESFNDLNGYLHGENIDKLLDQASQ